MVGVCSPYFGCVVCVGGGDEFSVPLLRVLHWYRFFGFGGVG